jgi:AraC-like DNA-binding protein
MMIIYIDYIINYFYHGFMSKELKYKPLYRDWLNLSCHLLWCYEEELAQHAQDSSVYKNSGAWLVRKGWAEVEHDGHIWRAEAGQWLIVKPVERTQRWSDDARLLSVAFDAKWPDGRSLIDEGLSLVLDADEHPALERHAMQLVREIKHVAKYTWDARHEPISIYRYMKLQSRLSLWLSELAAAVREAGIRLQIKQDIDQRVIHIVRLIDELAVADHININELAEAVDMSSVHLTRLFKEQLNVTPVGYHTRVRIEEAKRRLHLPDARIKEVAIELGFFHLSHFSRWFKQHAGISPREFTKQVSSRANQS